MEKQYGITCGLDVHKKILVASVNDGTSDGDVLEFGASTKEILRLIDWVKERNVEMVGMESTGSYWKPVYNLMEANDVPCEVLNPQHIKNVPGRKTDVKDAQWISQLVMFGLARPSYIPSRPQRELRELCVMRSSFVGERTRYLNRLQKILEGGNIKLSGTVSDINSKTSRNLLAALVDGDTFDEDMYDRMYAEKKIAHNLKASKERIIEDLNGCLTPLQKWEIKTFLAQIDRLAELRDETTDKIINLMSEEDLTAMTRLCQIPGISTTAASSILSVTGTDMSRFPTAGHFANWAGLCPGNNVSANKRKSGKTGHGNTLLKATLVNAAHSAVKNKNSFFYSQYQRLLHRGKKRAIVAVAHSMLIAIYHMLRDHEDFVDLGADYYLKRNRDRKIKAEVKHLKKMGAVVVLLDSASSPEEAAEMAMAAFKAKEEVAQKAADDESRKVKTSPTTAA